MVRAGVWSLALSGLLGLAILSGCGAANEPTILRASVVPWPPAGPAGDSGDLLLRAAAPRPVALERYDESDGRWSLVCVTPCEQTIPPVGTYRVAVGERASRPFGITAGGDAWMVLRIDADGTVWTRDSPSMRAWRRYDRMRGLLPVVTRWSFATAAQK